MEYIERIQATLGYMEHHLDRPITMEELVKAACFSGYVSYIEFGKINQ